MTKYSALRDQAVVEWLASAGEIQDPAACVERWRELEDFWFAKYAAGELTQAGQRANRIRHFVPGALEWSTEKALATFNEILALIEKNWCAFPDAAQALTASIASGRRNAVLTNGELTYQSRKVTETGLAKFGLPVLASSQLQAGKPDPQAFWRACEIMGCQPDAALMIGDNPNTDIAGAKAAGLHHIHIVRADSPYQPSEPSVSSLNEIIF